uniref:Uncharacterized protein n=1 Tax=Schistosoma haematobium TaxID=6185 RepID=A0A095C8Y6_SCHHA
MDNLKEIMRRNKAEISAELKNHGVQPDQSNRWTHPPRLVALNGWSVHICM